MLHISYICVVDSHKQLNWGFKKNSRSMFSLLKGRQKTKMLCLEGIIYQLDLINHKQDSKIWLECIFWNFKANGDQD
ncbi:unnamed protein product [Paramecium pentaurelia]|uniref:Uncharacterized protein n=1 Tax=Paramecium pentaurelia TaxID=43138 RepID=A0A8S1YL61_9CILI|nr:unnamed protein product [Paramecium pentaurelia]